METVKTITITNEELETLAELLTNKVDAYGLHVDGQGSRNVDLDYENYAINLTFDFDMEDNYFTKIQVSFFDLDLESDVFLTSNDDSTLEHYINHNLR